MPKSERSAKEQGIGASDDSVPTTPIGDLVVITAQPFHTDRCRPKLRNGRGEAAG
jgi:hypothetical protein